MERRALCVLFYLLVVTVPVIAKESAIRVVTSFSILEDLVIELGGNHVTVINLVPRNSDAHMYRPMPSDSVAVANADLIIFNGLGFEGWITRLIEDARKEDIQLIASAGARILTHDQETDPHAWQSFSNIRIYVQNISNKLIAMLPQHRNNLEVKKYNYLKKLDKLEEETQQQLAEIPIEKRIVVTSHDAFEYLGRELDIQFLAPVGLSLDAEASALDVASVIDLIRQRHITALFVENITNLRLLEGISAETDVAIGGRLYSDALSATDGPASTYLKMMKHNIESLLYAFGSQRRNPKEISENKN